ncbi:hypothetical protein GOP47_0028154 [Adiantum capillus-veneris]|nr:hypothetical protein GOP47_0028154 [Adiantum capillus-veneris]
MPDEDDTVPREIALAPSLPPQVEPLRLEPSQSIIREPTPPTTLIHETSSTQREISQSHRVSDSDGFVIDETTPQSHRVSDSDGFVIDKILATLEHPCLDLPTSQRPLEIAVELEPSTRVDPPMREDAEPTTSLSHSFSLHSGVIACESQKEKPPHIDVSLVPSTSADSRSDHPIERRPATSRTFLDQVPRDHITDTTEIEVTPQIHGRTRTRVNSTDTLCRDMIEPARLVWRPHISLPMEIGRPCRHDVSLDTRSFHDIDLFIEPMHRYILSQASTTTWLCQGRQSFGRGEC